MTVISLQDNCALTRCTQGVQYTRRRLNYSRKRERERERIPNPCMRLMSLQGEIPPIVRRQYNVAHRNARSERDGSGILPRVCLTSAGIGTIFSLVYSPARL